MGVATLPRLLRSQEGGLGGVWVSGTWSGVIPSTLQCPPWNRVGSLCPWARQCTEWMTLYSGMSGVGVGPESRVGSTTQSHLRFLRGVRTGVAVYFPESPHGVTQTTSTPGRAVRDTVIVHLPHPHGDRGPRLQL